MFSFYLQHPDCMEEDAEPVSVLLWDGKPIIDREYTSDKDHVLQLAIEEWQAIATECERQYFKDECYKIVTYSSKALCLFHFRDYFCDDCPIALKTGRRNCEGTPYVAFTFCNSSKRWAARLEGAYVMIDFLLVVRREAHNVQL